MIDLQKEAELANGYNLYAKETKGVAFHEGYIAGANSKYVQAEKLRAQIDVVEWIAIGGLDPTKVLNRLQEQLKTLENDTNRNE